MDSSQFSDDEDSEDLNALRERTRGAVRVYCCYPPETRAAKLREYLRESLREAHVGGPTNGAVQVWKPSGEQDARKRSMEWTPGDEQSTVLPATRVAIARTDCGEPAGGGARLDRITRVQPRSLPDWAVQQSEGLGVAHRSVRPDDDVPESDRLEQTRREPKPRQK